MYTKKELYDRLKSLLALEFNCAVDDFNSSNNIITKPVEREGQRKYIDGTFFFKMVTMGNNAIISADESLHERLREFVMDKTGHHLFEHRNLVEIDNILNQYNKRLWQTHHMFLPDTKNIPMKEIAPIKWHEQEDIMKFYEGKQFPNALCEKFQPERPDMLAVTAYDRENIIGMAGCSADTADMWQIGIDVNEKYRGKGIGTYLVTQLKNEVLKRDKIPFYGTSLSNLHSWNIAINSGFYPAWVEVETIEG
ncbi:MAG: N-acetyltransferase [Anaerocolumna sp.]|jgi:GNAT superfamily N-acetyltransferase|nr:N-acetyltransferase [Anaerocolumna sp.]